MAKVSVRHKVNQCKYVDWFLKIRVSLVDNYMLSVHVFTWQTSRFINLYKNGETKNIVHELAFQ